MRCPAVLAAVLVATCLQNSFAAEPAVRVRVTSPAETATADRAIQKATEAIRTNPKIRSPTSGALTL